MGEKRFIVETIVRKKKNWIEHIMRGDGLMKEVVEEEMEGKRRQSRSKQSTILNIMRLNLNNESG